MKGTLRFSLSWLFILVMINPSFAQWVQTNGPFGGDIRSLYFTGTYLLAGTASGRVFVSTNDGDQWIRTGLKTNCVDAIINCADTLIAGDYYGQGAFRSTDGGASWTQATGLGTLSVAALVNVPGYVLAGTNGGIYRSANAGKNWGSWSLSGVVVNAFAVSGSNVYAGTSNGLYQSTNSGTSWIPSTTMTGSVSVVAVLDTCLFSVTETGIYRSTNSGTSWTNVLNKSVYAIASSDTKLFAGTSTGIFLSVNHGTTWTQANAGLTSTYVQALAAFHNAGGDTNVFAGTSAYVFRSRDNGSNWSKKSTGLTGTKGFALGISGTNLYAGTSGNGVFLSTNNGTGWSEVNSGLTDPDVRALAVSGSSVIAGTYGGTGFLSTDDGTSWTSVFSPGVAIYAAAASDGTFYFGNNGSSGVYNSTDGGTTWHAANSSLTTKKVSSLLASGSVVFAGMQSSAGVFLSTDGGTGWTHVSSGMTCSVVQSLAFCGTNVFAGTDNGVFLSTNNGGNWTQVDSGLTNSNVRSLAVFGTNVFAGTLGGGVFLSSDNGTTWSEVNSGLENNLVYSLLLGGGCLFAGTSGDGVWQLPLVDIGLPVEMASYVARASNKDVTLTWETKSEVQNAGFNILRKRDNESDYSTIGGYNSTSSLRGMGTSTTGRKYSFTDSKVETGAVYNYIIEQVSAQGAKKTYGPIRVTVSAVPSEYSLSQCYPNPFNPSTKIGYQLPVASHVTLRVYDMLGREVKTLVDEVKPAGQYGVKLDARDLPSGVYFYRLEAGTYHDTKRLVLLK